MTRATTTHTKTPRRAHPAVTRAALCYHDRNDTESGRVAAQQRGTHRPTPCGYNRLIEVHDASNAIIATYRYDPFGRRLSKTANNQSTYYFYSAEGLIAEADSNGQIIQSYGYAPGSTFTTNPLWTKLTTAGTATYYTYQNDHLGTPQKLLNQSGLTVWSATYDAFCRATIDPASIVTNNLRYPGQYADAETGLHYNWERYYDSLIDRYTTKDRIGLNGGVNLYAYAYGNPLRWGDPMGLYTEIVVWQPVGHTSSSFGHVSSNVNGVNYSWGPGGWDKNPSAASYAQINQKFRSGVGTVLKLTPEQEKRLVECYAKKRKDYGAVSNNCGDPHKDCLKEAMGDVLSDSFFPVNIGNDLIDSKYYGGTKIYEGPVEPRKFFDDGYWVR